MTDEQEQEQPDALSIPVVVEAEIATLWGDNVVAAQLTRQVARAMAHQGKDEQAIRAAIRNSGRVVD